MLKERMINKKDEHRVLSKHHVGRFSWGFYKINIEKKMG